MFGWLRRQGNIWGAVEDSVRCGGVSMACHFQSCKTGLASQHGSEAMAMAIWQMAMTVEVVVLMTTHHHHYYILLLLLISFNNSNNAKMQHVAVA